VSAPQRYSVYDQFAWCYSRGWSDDYHEQARRVFEGHVFPALPPAARILDLCCGSGELAASLLVRGFQVTGIDGSARMLEFAHSRAPGVRFLLADARAFHLDAAFDAVLSTFDSLNHILQITALETVFRNVYAALAAPGLFVFDLNMSDSFEMLWRGSIADVHDDFVAITRGTYDPAERLGRADITTFRSSGAAWLRSDVAVFEKCYSEDQVCGALKRAGFSNISPREACQLGMRGDISIGRTFFFATK
jgi:SAM-dependent methyltransferase